MFYAIMSLKKYNIGHYLFICLRKCIIILGNFDLTHVFVCLEWSSSSSCCELSFNNIMKIRVISIPAMLC